MARLTVALLIGLTLFGLAASDGGATEQSKCADKGCGPSSFHFDDSCQCDQYCVVHGDCCQDYSALCSSKPTMSPAMYHQFVVHTEPDLDASCARKQCHPQRSFNRGDSCQCDVGCARHEDCCHDYVDVCGDVHEDLPPISIPHDEVSEFQTCEHKSCGPSGFHRLDLCQCDAYCTVVGDCCDDFEDVCAPLDAHCPSQSCACPPSFKKTIKTDQLGCPVCSCEGSSGLEGQDGQSEFAEADSSSAASISSALVAGVIMGIVVVIILVGVMVRYSRRSRGASSGTPSASIAATHPAVADGLDWDNFDVTGSDSGSMHESQNGSITGSAFAGESPHDSHHSSSSNVRLAEEAPEGDNLEEVLVRQYQNLEQERQNSDFWSLDDAATPVPPVVDQEPNAFTDSSIA